jgi:hypothetical protein
LKLFVVAGFSRPFLLLNIIVFLFLLNMVVTAMLVLLTTPRRQAAI